MSIFTQMLVPVLAAQTAANGLIKPLGHHELLLVLVQLSLLLPCRRDWAVYAPAQPAARRGWCLRALLAPSLFGWIFPSCKRTHISENQSDLLSVVSWLGVLFF